MYNTHVAAIKLSLGLWDTRCRALQICTIAQAPIASKRVHITEDAVREVGNIVANSDKNRGDYRMIN
jgi:hypothetical protein